MNIEDIDNPSKVEQFKAASQGLHLPIPEDLQSGEVSVSEASMQLLKFHGTYQQDNRDTRIARRREGLDKEFSFMIRNRIPGGRLTADQFLAELDLAEKFGNGTIRLTTRQSIQIHGVLKQNLRAVIHAINRIGLSTQSACGDVNRNVTCCPAPFRQNPIREEMQAMAVRIADLLRPKTHSYHDLWITDPDSGEKANLLAPAEVDEPLYGKLYLPRKFKVGIALCDDNCIDVYDQDIGLLAVTERSRIIGYNVLAGGSMGTTANDKKCFPALAKRLTFLPPEQIPVIATAIVLVQRDHGDRSNRRQARMKYLIHRWGLERFRNAVESRLEEAGKIIGAGRSEIPATLPDPHPSDVVNAEDHLGWFDQGDGGCFLGIPIENGRVKDTEGSQLKSALRAVFSRYQFPARITAQQNLLLTDIAPTAKPEVEQLLKDHGVILAEQLTPVRRQSFACPALPTCGLALTESERALPGVLTQFEGLLEALNLSGLDLDVRMTGCANGCARPYNAEIGLVGSGHDLKTKQGKYTIFLGGSRQGNRLNAIFREKVLRDDLIAELRPVFGLFNEQRKTGEGFGDFCSRYGVEQLRAHMDSEGTVESFTRTDG